MRARSLPSRLVVLTLLSACAADPSGDPTGGGGKADDLGVDAEPADDCAGAATYQLTMENRWQQSPPLVASMSSSGFPNKAEHVARIIGGVHGPDDTGPWAWKVGQPASSGVERTAEVNDFESFRDELLASGLDTFNSDDSFVTTLELAPSQLYEMPEQIHLQPATPMVTMMAMIAPSPDWFIGLSGQSMCEDGQWIDARTFPLPIYDAGTEVHLDADGEFGAPQFNLSGSGIDGGVIQRFEDSDQNQVGPLAASIGARFTTTQSEISWTFIRVE